MAPKFIGKVKLTTQGQLTLPQEARKDLKIDSGDELYWYEHEGSLVLITQLMSEKDLQEQLRKKR